MRLKQIHHIPLTVLAITVLPITGFSQANNSLRPKRVRIAGRVTDVTKAGVPKTVVTLKVPGVEEEVAEVRSDQDGHFSFQSVPAREYEIRFQASNFYQLTLQAKRAAEGGEYDVGIVALTLQIAGDTIDIHPLPLRLRSIRRSVNLLGMATIFTDNMSSFSLRLALPASTWALICPTRSVGHLFG